ECNILFQKGSAGAKSTATFLAETLRKSAGFSFPVREAGRSGKGCIIITTAGADPALGNEGYLLEVTPEQVIIRAPQTAGLFYGVQTLRQLLPAETFGSKRIANQESLRISSVRIEDYPRFEWRGMHLDVSRHFFDVA